MLKDHSTELRDEQLSKPLYYCVGKCEHVTCQETRKRLARNRARRERDQAYRDCGLVKVRGALGGTYWESPNERADTADGK